MENNNISVPTRIDREKDGKIERDFGNEELEKDKIKGGIGDKKKLSDFDPEQVKMGIKVELEHTDDEEIAKDIVKDHLTEDPKYYTKLKTIEKSQLKERWTLIKKELDNKKAIISITDALQPEEEKGDVDNSQMDSQGDQEDQGTPIPDQDAVQEADSGQDESPEASGEQGGEGPENIGEAQNQFFDDSTQKSSPDQSEGGEDKQHMFEDELLHMEMKNQGFTDSQIDYILHGHIPATATAEDIKSEAEKAMNEINQVKAKNNQTQESGHKQELHDQNKEHKDVTHKNKNDHQVRMNDLDYEKARLALEREKAAKDIKTTDHHAHMSAEQEREYKKKLQEIDIKHADRMKQLEYDFAHEDRTANDIDTDHKKKLLALEYEKAKKEAALEIKYKEEELEIKLEQLRRTHDNKTNIMNEQHSSKMAMQNETNKAKIKEHKQKLTTKAAEKQDAAHTSEAEKKGEDNT